jgi:hypothetical protein
MHSQERVKATDPNSQDVVPILTSHDQPLNDPKSSSASTNSHETGSQTEDSSISSLDSTIGSEGERSFVYGANDEDQYPFSPGYPASFLSGRVARMIFQAFVYERCRGRPEQNGGSSDRSTSQHDRPKHRVSCSTVLPRKGTSTKRPTQFEKNAGDSEDSDDGRSVKRQIISPSKQDSGRRFFACPYYKFNVRR